MIQSMFLYAVYWLQYELYWCRYKVKSDGQNTDRIVTNTQRKVTLPNL